MRLNSFRSLLSVLVVCLVLPLAPLSTGCGGGGAGSTRLMYIVNTAANSVSQYKVNSDGSLTPLATPTVATGSAPVAIAVDSTGNYAYVVNSGDNTVSQYEVGADGSLTPLTPATVATGQGPSCIIIHPNGRFVYVGNATDKTITVYSVTGRDVPTKQVLVQARVVDVNQSGLRAMGFDFTANYLYSINSGSDTVSQFSAGTDGTLTPLNPATATLPFSPTAMAMNPRGPSFYVTGSATQLVTHAIIGPNGTISLQVTPQLNTGLQPSSVAVDPSGQTIYVTNFGDNTVSQFYMDNGIMKALSPSNLSVLSQPRVLTLQGDDAFILAPNAVGVYGKALADVPTLGSIPVIGNLFRSNTLPSQGNQLVVFVTPRVINGP